MSQNLPDSFCLTCGGRTLMERSLLSETICGQGHSIMRSPLTTTRLLMRLSWNVLGPLSRYSAEKSSTDSPSSRVPNVGGHSPLTSPTPCSGTILFSSLSQGASQPPLGIAPMD